MCTGVQTLFNIYSRIAGLFPACIQNASVCHSSFMGGYSLCLQIYVEVPRARLTMELARIKEADGDIASAATILQELQVNSYIFSMQNTAAFSLRLVALSLHMWTD